jgi:predicted DNA repair protein MutK
MLGGAYLCFEGAEKVFHWLFPHQDEHVEKDLHIGDPVHLEETRVKGAIKTDFILSAEIMTIILANIEAGGFWYEAATLALAGVAVTILVYGSVALIVKMDDIGLWLAARGITRVTRSLGRGLVKGMPLLLTTLSVVGTAAMLWVGGSIILHGMEALGLPWLYDYIHHLAVAAAEGTGKAAGFIEWCVTALLDGIFGMVLGMALIPIVTRFLGPLAKLIIRKSTKSGVGPT